MATNAVIIDNIAGISIKSFREIRQAIATSFTEVFGASINLEPSSPDGMLVDLLAYLYTELAQALQTIGANMDVSVATILFLTFQFLEGNRSWRLFGEKWTKYFKLSFSVILETYF